MGRKKKEAAIRAAVISDMSLNTAINALKEILNTEVNDGEGIVDETMTINAMRQQAELALGFIDSLDEGDDEVPKRGKEIKAYAKR